MTYIEELFHNTSFPELDDTDLELLDLSDAELHAFAEAAAQSEKPHQQPERQR